MGYSERVCQLCGISFNIARMRKPDEPESDAWGSTGDGWVSHHYDGYPASLHDGRHDATCRDIRRGEPAPGLERDMWHFEHVPGPSCAAAPEGYSGWRIGAEEMREQTKIQCLVAKEQGWRPEPGDEDFEVDAKECFVTGIAGRVDEFDAYGFNPVKHGVESSLINSTDDDDTDEPWGLPMHPSCFYIFRRMSTARFSRIDIDGLWHLRTAQGGYPRFDHFPEREDVQLVGEQWYSHVPGTEYLAANPVEVPALGELIQNCTKTASDVVFDARPEPSPHRDPFVSLSSELRMMLLPLLERKDVANLRSASKSFSQLPQSYFRHLVRTEMPWVWETDGTQGQQMDWFALWTGLSAADGADCADEKERFAMSGLLDTIAEKGVTERPKEIRGLRNRRMIYRDIKIILSRIAKLTPEQRA